MAKQGRWILKNVRHDRPGVTIQGVSLSRQGSTLNIGSVTSKKRDTINTEWYTNLGVGINVDSLTKNPEENSIIEYGGLKYKVKWVLTEKPITPEPGYINISRNKIDALCENNSLFTITVDANVDWTVEVSQGARSWLSVQDITSTSFKVKILDSTENARTGIITVKSTEEGEAPSKTLTVTQPDCRPEEPSIDIDVPPMDILCENNPSYAVIVTARNTEWDVEVTEGGGWITITNKSSNGFNINIADSATATRNGTVSVKSTTEGVDITKTISISQPDCRPETPSIDVDTSPINAECEGNQPRTITVVAKNTDWDVEVTQGDSWITISNKTSNSFLVNIADSTVGERSGSIKVKSTTPGVSITKTISVTQPDCRPEEPSIDINIYEINAACESNQPKVITVTAKNTEWDIEIIQEGNWITISNRTSNGFTVNVADSTVGPRSGSIKVKSTTPGVNITKTISVSQPDCTPEADRITVDPDNKSIPCDVSESTTFRFNVSANVAWHIEDGVETTYDWIHIVATGETYFDLKFEKNDASDAVDRTANIRIIAGTATATVTISQNKCQEGPIFEPFDSLDKFSAIPCPGGTFYFRIKTNLSEELVLESNDMGENGWITLEEVASQEEGIRVIAATFQENGLSERHSTITVSVKNRPDITAISIPVTQLACQEAETFDVDTSDIHFECNDSMYSLQISATDGVTWTATTSDNRFGVYLESENPSQEVTGTGSEMLHITPLTDNRNVSYDIEGTLRIQSSLGDDVTINLYQAPTPVLEYDGQTQLQFSKNGETKALIFKANFDVNVTISQSTNWLSYTKGNLGSTADDGLQIEFSANENPIESQLSATVTISTAYDGNCEKPSNIVIYMYQEEGDPYIPPVPDAYFDVYEIYSDYPDDSELGGYVHERSFMSEDYYECCADFNKRDVDGVVYLMPLRARVVQVYYDTNVDIDGLTYEIEHVTPTNPEQEWLEVVMKPEEYGCIEDRPDIECGWYEEDSRGEPYPGDFILIKTRDRYTGTSLYEDTYTGYVHIKEKATGNILCSIPVKCIKTDIRGESVEAAGRPDEGFADRNLVIGTEDLPGISAAGGFVVVWVFTNDSAYINDYIPGTFVPDDNDVNWDRLTFYYPDGETRFPVTSDMDPNGYIDKIYDTSCNEYGAYPLLVYVSPNTDYMNKKTHGFRLTTESAGYELFDTGNKAQVRIIQDKDNETYRNNYRIVEFYATDGGITPVADETVTDSSQITGGTCDGSGHSTHPFFKAIYDYGRASSPGTVYTAETMNDSMIIYDEQAGHDILNPNVLEVTNITYQGGYGWIDVNQNYTPLKNQPFEFNIKPNTGYTSDGNSREAVITITYKNCSPQISRTLTITQSYKQVEPATFGVYLWATNSQGDRVGNDVEATVTPNSNKEFSFEILTSSNAEGYVMPYVGDNPEPQYYDGIQDYVSAVSSITYYAQDFNFSTAMSLYMSGGIEFPEVANKGSYKIKTYGQAFDLKLLCRDKNDPLVQRILTIHVNAC